MKKKNPLVAMRRKMNKTLTNMKKKMKKKRNQNHLSLEK